jgi:hypothetical protein
LAGIAIMMLVHKNEQQVQRLINHLSKDFGVFVHIDKRSKIEIMETDNIFIYKKYKPYWGSFNIVKATLLLMNEAYNKGYNRFILLSGQDLPLKSNADIKMFFEGNRKEYIHNERLPCVFWHDNGGCDRLTKYYAPKIYRNKRDVFNAILYILLRLFCRLISRIKPRKIQDIYYGGSQWFSLTDTTIKGILEYIRGNQEYINRFYFSNCSDEIFFQTIINKIKGIDIVNNDLRYIDWKTGPEYPRILRGEDCEKLICSKDLFGRKFDETVDKNIIEKIYGIIGEDINGSRANCT